MSRLESRFAALRAEERTALIPYIAAGHPTAELTVELLHSLARAGADVIELGVPFSDPMADGPTVQRASEVALANGVGLVQVLAMVTQFRASDSQTPLVLMGYANPIEHYGIEAFAQAAQEAGVDGVLVVDYPPEESIAFAAALRAHQIDPIFLIAPTTTLERIALVAEHATGYVYYVSLKGTTGASHLDVSTIAARLPEVRRLVHIPIGVGFGIRDTVTAKAVAGVADAVVIGSRIIEELENAPRDQAVAAVESLVRGFREALDAHPALLPENA
jgi:tryptophan synthase alpha chain